MLSSYQKKIFLSKSKSNFYINNKIRNSFDKLENSKKKILKKIKLNNKKILDVGCATGDMYAALKKFNIFYTGIDIDKNCIIAAKKKYNSCFFYNYDLFSKKIKKKSFDVVMIWSLFYMFPNWKDILKRACEISKKYVLFDNKVRFSGSTVIDLDTSYQYYHKSNKRNYYIIHNIYELISYFQIHELNLSKVDCVGYRLPSNTSARLPLSKKEVNVAAFMLTINNKSNIIRTGTTKNSTLNKWVNFNIKFPGFFFNE
jgi:ubiquinone/menaquinone biosynthesis C-methylase UbiE